MSSLEANLAKTKAGLQMLGQVFGLYTPENVPLNSLASNQELQEEGLSSSPALIAAGTRWSYLFLYTLPCL